MKTCLIIAGGYMFFADLAAVPLYQLLKNVLGVCVAMIGVFAYTYVKLTSV